MSTKVETQNVIEGPFHLGAWLVEPRLNRLTRDGESIQIELKMMDVLVCLAEHAGELVERQTLIDTVWATEFISENILTRAIAELRNVLGDDAKNPSFIETIHRRGYTLVAPVETAASDEAVTAKVARFPIPEGRVEDERGPYPGLAAFTEDDAEFFFGRETEVTQLWRKLTTRRLLAVIGPSGVGKSSLLHAGLIPSAPNGWGALICQPGEAPFAALARSLAPQFEGDPEAISKLVDVSDENTALALLSRWRQLHEQALLIIDQFEELFTQCPAEVQAQFADLLGRIAREADIHVLLSMRDDFHYRCHEHPALAPVFDSIVPISAPARADLRRALIEPATRFGFSFEEEGIVEDMLDAVEGERGALPLLAFSIARLWDERDSTRRLLTKETCDAIGGVQGALARHAERTLSTIGAARLPTVREIFRNLVTAQGTRATRYIDELLSVFDDPDTARVVLADLIDFRLLTTYEIATEDGDSRRSVEIVHESLLDHWPRLVRWRTQDADAAQLRDQLRQAAKTWDEQGRSDDTLWTGSAFREFAVWRERYPGGLSETEAAFAAAMIGLATRRRRRRRLAIAAVLVIAVAVTSVVTVLWRQSVFQGRRAEAQKLVAMGQLQLEEYPTAALAHAIASLELSDGDAARHLALDALWRGPTAFVVNDVPSARATFTSDGRHLIQCFFDRDKGPLRLIGENGSTAPLEGTNGNMFFFSDRSGISDLFALERWAHAAPPSRRVFTERVELWSATENRMLGSAEFGGHRIRGFAFRFREQRGIALVSEEPGQFAVDEVNFDGSSRRLGVKSIRIDPDVDQWKVRLDYVGGTCVVASTGHDIYISEVSPGGVSDPRFIGRQTETVTQLATDPRGRYVVSADSNGRIHLWDSNGEQEPIVVQGPMHLKDVYMSISGHQLRAIKRSPSKESEIESERGGEVEAWIWSLDERSPRLLRRMALGKSGQTGAVYFDFEGHLLARSDLGDTRLWPLSAPADADPVLLLRGEELGAVNYASFHPSGTWLAGSDGGGLTMWPLSREYPSIIRVHHAGVSTLRFGPDGEWLASASRDRRLRLWPLAGEMPPSGELIFESPRWLGDLAVSADGRFFLAGSESVHLVVRDSGASWQLPTTSRGYFSVALSADGRYAAAASGDWDQSRRSIEIWNLETRQRIAEIGRGSIPQRGSPHFIGDNHVIGLDQSGLRRWNINTGEGETLYGGTYWSYAKAQHGSKVLLLEKRVAAEGGRAIFLDLENGDATPLTTHGNQISAVALDQSGQIAVTADNDGEIRVGLVTGEEPHLLLGHQDRVTSIAVDPHYRWIASGGGRRDHTIRLWPMPDLSKLPLHTLPREELIAKLKTLTNLRIVRDLESPTGWDLTQDPFPGWAEVPTW